AVEPRSSFLAKKDIVTQRGGKEVEALKGYKLGECVGKGAFGSVYRAFHWGTGETVAVKQVKLADLPKSELRVIMVEIDLLANLKHPNIVKYQGSIKSSDSLYILLEYCENGSLHSICKNFGKFPENLVALYMAQVLHGLLYLHEQGVIHRDIKGANILTTKDGVVKLADFGVATRMNGMHESNVVGTPYWMAPEIIELSGATTASDIWSLGCTVIELLDGKPPFHKFQPMQALFRIVNEDHPPLPEGASPAVRDFLMQCFQKDPYLRVSARKLLRHPWIVSAKKSDHLRPAKPTKYDEAVKSVQEWNEALKSPNSNTIRRSGRTSAASPLPGKAATHPSKLVTPSKPQLGLVKPRTKAESFRSPAHSSDNWDNDFPTSIPSSGLRLPQAKPKDNFAGKFSAEKLKAYSSQETQPHDEERWDNDFEGELTVKSPLRIAETDPLKTIRPLLPSLIGSVPDPKLSERKSRRIPSRTSAKAQKKSQLAMEQASKHSEHPTYQKTGSSDYSQLTLPKSDSIDRKNGTKKTNDEILFSKTLQPAESKRISHNTPSANLLGESIRRTSTQPELEIEDYALRRTRSSVEIQRYAENEDDDDYSDVFSKLRGDDDEAESESESEPGTLMLNSKLSNNSWLGDDEDDEDDPFAQLEEGFDEMDLEANIARDKNARLGMQVEALVGSLKTTQTDDVLADLSEQLLDVLIESPDTKGVIISAHGMLPMLEILENSSRRDVIWRLLRIVNAIIFDDVEIQENLCFVGGIPIISKFASRKQPTEIRLEAAAFVRQIYQTSTLTLQMFVSCGGLNVLVEFLEEDFEGERDLVLIGVDGIWNVFELQGPTPKNDFCRILSRSSVLYPLSLLLNRILNEKGELAELCEGRIVNIFYLFSQAENHVKEMVADRKVLKPVLKNLRRLSPQHQITMLKFIKNLSMLSTTLDALHNSNAIEVLIDLLSSKMHESHFKEISNQVLNTMFNLCRLSTTRQEDAALNGVIPLLQRIVQTERPLKEFALPILCDMVHSGQVGRDLLWQNKGLRFYITLLSDPYWQVTALDAIFVWLQEETAKVEQHLLDGTFSEAIASCFISSKANAFENLLDPLQKLLRLSPPVALSLARPDLFSRILSKLGHNKAVIRLNLLRIVRSICDAADPDSTGLLQAYGLADRIHHLADRDPAVLVRNMAADLLRADENRERSVSATRSTRRSSSSSSPVVATPPVLVPSGSLPQTPLSGRTSSYFELSPRTPLKQLNGSLAPRPTSRDSLNSVNGDGFGHHSSLLATSLGPSRLPRTSSKIGGRASLAPGQGFGKNSVASMAPSRRKREGGRESR
ncbi:MAG: hypothetical protein M1814_004623, partial [Vezdaea aestivalis]